MLLVTIIFCYYIIVLCILISEIFNIDKSDRVIKTKKDLYHLLFPFPLIHKLLYELFGMIKGSIMYRINKIIKFFKELE